MALLNINKLTIIPNTNTKHREEYIKQYSKPGALRAGFEYYRAIFEDAEQNKEYAKEKLDMPILTIC